MIRRFFTGLAFAVAAGLVGAALLHLIIVLALPHFSENDAYTRVLKEGETQRFYRLTETADRAGLSKDDPFVETAVCGFDVSEGPVRLTAENTGLPFWSLGIYDGASNEVFRRVRNHRIADGQVRQLAGSHTKRGLQARPHPVRHADRGQFRTDRPCHAAH